MSQQKRDVTGQTFGYLKVIKCVGTDSRRNSLWELLCACGKTKILPMCNFAYQHNRKMPSCGCMTRVTNVTSHTIHGMYDHKAYAVWRHMLERCHVKTHPQYLAYGGRGITVCDEWRTSFGAFWLDMGTTYRQGMTLERRNNALGYSANNCRWQNGFRQHNNTRQNVIIATPIGNITIGQAARRYKLNYQTLYSRLNAGWPVLQAIGVEVRA